MAGFTDADVTDQSGKCVLITGANTGIGFAAARVLAGRGARVILACRNAGKAKAAIDAIRQVHKDADLAALALDQADLDSVRRAAESAANEPRIDVLVNNAGVMLPPLTRTAQGFELQFGVNHLGTFALTALLREKLAQTEGARVVVTASVAHRRGRLDWDDLDAQKRYRRFDRYAASKLANMAFMLELDRRLRGAGIPLIASGCHPGVATTELDRHSGGAAILYRGAAPLLNTAAMGAWPTLHAAVGPVRPGGYYGPSGFMEMRGPSKEAARSRMAQDPALTKRLWDVSIEMTGIDPGLPPVA